MLIKYISKTILQKLVILQLKSINVLATLSILLVSITVMSPGAYAEADIFKIDDMPFGKSYETWVQDWWRWNAAIPKDPQTTFAGVKENGCLINKNGSVVMLIDPAIGGKLNQVCEISADQGILFPAWSAECDGSTKGMENKSFKELSECARGYNLGKVMVNVRVDNNHIAKVDVNDYKTINLVNATELYTKEFNITTPKESHLSVDYPGTHLGAVHGWFIFLKPLTPGEHTVNYVNVVKPTSLSGAGNANNANITYLLKVR